MNYSYNPSQLNTIDADTLMSTPLPATRFIIDKLVPQGLHILAGAPKIGKSWLALWLCLCVSKGEPVWNFPTAQGTVLYLCLEDSYTRIQNRLFKITDDAPSTLHFANLAGNIGAGLENQINGFIRTYPQTNLIVIDTLQRVRQTSEAANPYASDYRDLTTLKNLADRHGIAILLIHHLRKMNDDDPLNMISGTTGISGATDSNFVLKESKRGSKQAILICTGRDIEHREMPLSFHKDTHTWALTEPIIEEAPAADPEAVFLSAFLMELVSFDGTATTLSELLEQSTGEKILPSVLSKKLAKHSNELNKLGIHISSSRTRDVRLLHIHCDSSDGNDGKNETSSVEDLPSQPSHLSRTQNLPL